MLNSPKGSIPFYFSKIPKLHSNLQDVNLQKYEIAHWITLIFARKDCEQPSNAKNQSKGFINLDRRKFHFSKFIYLELPKFRVKICKKLLE